jgi:prepilin-type N-terminal cleavage/methylation domain-containing protein
MRHQRGFSLVEILAAFLILTIVITTSLVAFIERNKRLQQASEIILAYQVLANEAEFWRRKAFANLEKEPLAFESETDLLKPLEPFNTIVAVKESAPGVKSVQLTIRWRDGEKQARLEILRADTGGSPLW